MREIPSNLQVRYMWCSIKSVLIKQLRTYATRQPRTQSAAASNDPRVLHWRWILASAVACDSYVQSQSFGLFICYRFAMTSLVGRGATQLQQGAAGASGASRRQTEDMHIRVAFATVNRLSMRCFPFCSSCCDGLAQAAWPKKDVTKFSQSSRTERFSTGALE